MSPSKAQGDLTKGRILRVATELFAAHGYHGTGITELSRAVGLGRGALYHHITSKEDLLYQISTDLLRRMITEAECVVAEHEDAEDGLRALARLLVLEHATRRDAWALVITETRSLTPEHRDDVIELRDAYEAIWGDLLVAAAEAGAIRPVDSIERRAILGMLNSTARWVRPTGALTPGQIADRHMDLLIAGLRPCGVAT
jgi:AcrR family transcriptional regulator